MKAMMAYEVSTPLNAAKTALLQFREVMSFASV